MMEIMSRNKEAQVEATRLRRQMMQLLEEAVELGLIKKEETNNETLTVEEEKNNNNE